MIKFTTRMQEPAIEIYRKASEGETFAPFFATPSLCLNITRQGSISLTLIFARNGVGALCYFEDAELFRLFNSCYGKREVNSELWDRLTALTHEGYHDTLREITA